MHGVMIKRLGHNAHILEHHASSVRDGQAAGISTGPYMQKLFRKIDHCDGGYALLSPGIQHIDTDSNVTGYRKITQMLTSWNTLYYRLRANTNSCACYTVMEHRLR